MFDKDKDEKRAFQMRIINFAKWIEIINPMTKIPSKV